MHLRKHVLTCAAALAAAPFATAGGLEVYCQGGVEIVERLPQGAGGLFRYDYELCNGPPGTNIYAPGFPQATCPIGGPFSARGVGQSLSRAAQAWNSAGLPLTGPATRLGIATSPTAFFPSGPYNTSTGAYGSQIGQDGRNVVTLWEEPITFFYGGNQFALAMSPVFTNAAGVIVEADIAFNAHTANGGIPFWSFVEDNATFGATVVTHLAPLAGYVDIEGVMVHELGHVVGLGHTLVDSQMLQAGSLSPTMFASPQGEPFSGQPVQTGVGAFCNITWNQGTTPSQSSIWGRSARTPEQDDLSAVVKAYGTAAAFQQTGSIAGRILDGFGNGARGVSVIAFKADQPDVTRAGELSYAGGQFRIDYLPPGAYYLMVERADGVYFGPLPNYLVPSQGGCVAPPPVASELWTGGMESANEPLDQAGLAIQVSAGVTFVADVVLESSGGNLLTVNGSAHGALYTHALGTPYPTAVLRVTSAAPNGNVVFLMDVQRQSIPFQGQLIQVPGTVSVTVTADGFGVAQLPLTLSGAWAYSSLFVQAGIDRGGTFELTNPVNVWLQTL